MANDLVELEFAELHNPLFLSGTNLQMKLDPHHRKGLKIVYDRTEKELLVHWQGKTAVIPSSNIASMVPGKVMPKEEPKPAANPGKPIKAQVSTPFSHVFAGEKGQ